MTTDPWAAPSTAGGSTWASGTDTGFGYPWHLAFGDGVLDVRTLAKGPRPPKSRPPSRPLASYLGFGVGSTWVGTCRGLRSWRFLALADVVVVAVVPASDLKRWLCQRTLSAPGPDLVLRDHLGRVVSVDVRRVDEEVRATLLSRLDARTCLSSVASAYLRSGELPGTYGRRWGALGEKRFGPRMP